MADAPALLVAGERLARLRRARRLRVPPKQQSSSGHDGDAEELGQEAANGAEVGQNAATQNFFREVNERVMELNASFNHDDAVDVVCECGRADCAERVTITRAAYERVRSDAAAFAMLAGHEHGLVEEVVERTTGYVIARNLGAAAKLAVDSDPRRFNRTHAEAAAAAEPGSERNRVLVQHKNLEASA
jgi:hypothetical protein